MDDPATEVDAQDNRHQNNTASQEKPHQPKLQDFPSEISAFVNKLEALDSAFLQTIGYLADKALEKVNDWQVFLETKAHQVNVGPNEATYAVPHNHVSEFRRLQKEVDSTNLALRIIPETVFCTLIHSYDAFLGALLRTAFLVRPELLNTCEKKLSFSELMTFQDVEAAREYIIEDEVESLLRKSHSEQFSRLESLFSVTLKPAREIWTAFIEMTERRNLFVHCAGKASRQYLLNCKRHGVLLPESLQPGTTLGVDIDYFRNALNVILEIGVEVGHVLWRHLIPNQLTQADDHLHYITYEFLASHRYALTTRLADFALKSHRKNSTDLIRRLNTVNKCLALKFSGDVTACLDTLHSMDWSAAAPKFHLAKAILEDDTTGALEVMRQIGTAGEVNKVAYSTWPLFKKFRQTQEFLDLYRTLFGEDFDLPGVSNRQLSEDTINALRSADNAETDEVPLPVGLATPELGLRSSEAENDESPLPPGLATPAVEEAT